MVSIQSYITWFVQLLSRIPENIVIGLPLHQKFYEQENLKKAAEIKKEKEVGVLFVINHVSKFDPILFLAGINPFSSLTPMFWLSQSGKKYKTDHESSWLSLIYGELFFYSYGCIPIESGLKNYAKTLSKHLEVLNKGHSVAIFPEGRIQRDTKRGEAHGGVAYLASESNALIVPVYIGGLRGMTVNEFWLGKRCATVTYGTPFFYSDLQLPNSKTVEDYKTGAEKVLDRVYKTATKRSISS